MRAIFGMDPLTSGKIYLEGREVRIRSPRDAISPGHRNDQLRDRKGFGLWPLPIAPGKHLAAQPAHAPQGVFINQRREKAECREYAQMLRVKSAGIEADAFSSAAGNQQKVVLAKWIMSRPKVLILDEPTRGVDVGAKSEIHSMMCKFAAEGMAIIMVSSELPEIMGVSDRILIYHEGRLNGEFTTQEIQSGAVGQEEILCQGVWRPVTLNPKYSRIVAGGLFA